jgi:protein-disulfide isomerase
MRWDELRRGHLRRIWLIGCVAAAYWLAPGVSAVEGQPGLAEVGFVLGDTAAPVKIIEFGDFGCTTCADFWRDSWPVIRRDLIDTGRVAWWHVPVTLGYRHGKKAAHAAQCAAEQGEYWSMHDSLLGAQEEWLSTRHPEEVFARLADEAELDDAAFSDCYDESRWEDRIEAATQVARRGVRALPTFFVNGRPVVGAIPYASFLRLVEEAERAGPGRWP